MLSAEKIVECRKKQVANTTTLTAKEFEPCESLEEIADIKNSLDEIANAISVERIKTLTALSHAVWKPELRLAEVTHQSGSQWFKMGHSRNKKLYLFPEEALYLLEIGSLEITYNGVPMSIQRAYFILLGPDSDVTLDKYRVFSYLNTNGYKVARHSNQKVEIECDEMCMGQPERKHEKRERSCDSDMSSDVMEINKKSKSDKINNLPLKDDNLREVLTKLKKFEPAESQNETELDFDYDIYLLYSKNQKFKKTSSKLPDYRIVIHRSDDPMPGLSEIVKLTKKLNDNVPVVNAIVFPDYIAFYTINPVIIPDAFDL